ncbi:hypothetical protein [Nitratireductor sp. GCM10026969]|uniref:hypothetical protein n=1 Tax=Nitratireductor sp. GCM10026969 TaxID=3252645 RepID=UPI0036106C93
MPTIHSRAPISVPSSAARPLGRIVSFAPEKERRNGEAGRNADTAKTAKADRKPE